MVMKMEGKREEMIRKGPWKAEEDEVLINHVRKYGPRDWSSIRSKGLLQRTGKSCRLRWVNKLRPNLKNGCKFSADEERIVIDLQAQFGNKWARIATYLPGRTDNDVKNFWSSRQKRLARILQNSPASSSSTSKSHKFNNPKSGLHASRDGIGRLEIPGLSSVGEEASSSKTVSCSSSYVETPQQIGMMPLLDLAKPEPQPLTLNANVTPIESYACPDSQMQISFPQIPQPQTDLPFSPESRELLARLDDPYFYNILDSGDIANEFGSGEQLPLPQPFFEPARSCSRHAVRDEPDVFLDDLPVDMFDQVDSLRSSLD